MALPDTGFILAGLVVAVIAVLLWRSQSRGAAAEASFSFGELFTAQVKLGQQETSKAGAAVERANHERGTPAPAAPISPGPIRLARVLWVDDRPDGNLFETLALERLGRFVTVATSTEAALIYLDELHFDLIITDLGRGRDREAGEKFVRHLRRERIRTPVVVYTTGAADKRDRLLGIGADAVADMPEELVHQVTALLSEEVPAARL